MRNEAGSEGGIRGAALTAVALLAAGLMGPAAAAAVPVECVEQGWLRCSGLQLEANGWQGLGTASTGIRYNFRNGVEDAGLLRFHVDARFDSDAALLRRWRYGAGVNLDLPGEGLLEANIQTSRRRGREGPRFALGDEGFTSAKGGRNWALGAYVAPSKGSNNLTVAPKLRFDLDELRALPGRAEVSAEFSPWERADDEHRGDRVWQVNFYWRY
jgi:opacity protein-like surface antigen